MTDDELETMLARATDGGDHEWGWYVDDVPRLIAYIRELQELEDEDRRPISFETYIRDVPDPPTTLPDIESAFGLPAGLLDGCEGLPVEEVLARMQAGVEGILRSPRSEDELPTYSGILRSGGNPSGQALWRDPRLPPRE